MPRKKKENVKSHLFRLDMTDSRQASLQSHLEALAETGDASGWIVRALVNTWNMEQPFAVQAARRKENSNYDD